MSMGAGQSLASVVGPSADVIFSNPNSSLAGAANTIISDAGVTSKFMDGGKLNTAAPVGNTSLNQYLGGQGEFGNFTGSKFHNFVGSVMAPAAGLMVIDSLLDMNRHEEQHRQEVLAANAPEELRKAEFAKEEAQKQQYIAEEEKRRQYFAPKPMM